ncbi:biotin--[acetyl-CoA-carboxylase] ligase [Candidatus Oleimmundimicrobium sp.]|uniref:biotin--[acetyl-CoA-carboxylase] ligase n=1 Tax=Candidatus Oleimmundimicrobium sp. TaxID=3060597 RepID=UPI00271C978E|nr:biotin--[acetyl-CoA-carboxylase] ligase [Candidatus Oleimmundimicrobium sp.]MDO8885656.1 biotin--[acetyl-CoA-carboxylase] ligase [Candidatus Oleimmundimicrobium sp.]
MSSKDAVLFFLKDKQGDFVSGEDISRSLSLSRTAVWKHIQSLKDDGYIIEGVPRQGYRLIKLPDKLLPSEIRYKLKTTLFDKKIYYFNEISSTNKIAKNEAAKGSPEGTLFVAEKQVKGKGRLGRKWVSPSGGIWFSMVLRPEISPIDASKITILAGIAVAKAIKGETGLKVTLKWPNDIFIDGKKVAGILSEMSAEADKVNFVVVGIGVNANLSLSVFSEELRDKVATLKELLGAEVDRVALFKAILKEFEKVYLSLNEDSFEKALSEWKNLCGMLGKRVKISTLTEEIEGEALDINEQGSLLLKLFSGEIRTIYSGDVVIKK